MKIVGAGKKIIIKRYEIGSVYKSKSDLYIMESNKLIKKKEHITPSLTTELLLDVT